MVSVVLPTYSRAESGLLARAIDSVLGQTFQSFELIVMDDGSTDGTADLLADYTKVDDRVIHVRHENNSGLPALRVNEGLVLGRGRYCAYQFDDDRWTPDALQTLVGELEKQSEYAVAYGKSEVSLDEQVWVIGEQFNYSKLLSGNYIANNSLIHRRAVFEQFGGYDMHLVMRRLCDWDLWLRWGRQVRFLFVDHLVSLVDAAMEGSLGKTVHFDALTARAHMARNRDRLLTPGKLNGYDLNSLEHLQHLGKRKLNEIWRHLVAPFQSRHREIWMKVAPESDKRIHVLVTKANFDTAVDITINNFQELLAADFAFTFIPQAQVDEAAIRSSDILLLHRTIDLHACDLLRIAKKYGKSVAFLMDDDLLTFHELSEEFSYLAPGALCRGALEKLICDADVVVTYSQLMQQSVALLNPRHVRLETNVREHWLENTKTKLAAAIGDEPASVKKTIKIAFAGGGARKEEFAVLWPAIVEVSRQMESLVEFHFWGFAPKGLDELVSPNYCENFTYSYEEYLSRVADSNFDVMIVPLFDEHKAKRAKCPIKFLEIAVAGAVGVYSDVEPYQVVKDGVTGFKCENTIEAWTAAILKAVKLSARQRHDICAASLEQVMLTYTSERQASRVSATFEAALLHSSLNRSLETGKPRIAYFCHSPYLGGAENHLLRHALIAQYFQFEPILVLPASTMSMQEEMLRRASEAGIRVAYLPLFIETDVNKDRALDEMIVNQVSAWLLNNQISLVHSVTLMRELGVAARRIGIPHISSLYATNSTERSSVEHCNAVHSDSLLYANQWAHVLDVPSRCILSFVPEEYFHAGLTAKRTAGGGGRGNNLRVGVFGTLQERKGQKQAVEAIGMLYFQHGIVMSLDVYGYDHFFPDYLEECKAIAEKYGVGDFIKFHGFVQNTASVLSEIDIVLCSSDWESLPQVILEGMAARRLVVSPPVGGVAEVLSEKTGVVIRNNSAVEICGGLLRAARLDVKDMECRLELAQKVVESECTKYSVATSLFQLYRFANTQLPKTSRSFDGAVAEPIKTSLFQGEGELVGALERVRNQLHELNSPEQNVFERQY